jgi:shikimate kinase
MGTGKTTVGKLLAQKFKKEFIESDDVIVKKANKSIPDIFSQNGEITFREIEMQVCKELSQKNNCVISTGGGVVLNKLNIDYFKINGTIVLLEATAKDIFNRISIEGKEKRPLLNKPDPMNEIKDLLMFRKPFYDSAADLKISTYKKMPEQIADEIMDALKSGNAANASGPLKTGKSLGALFNELSNTLITEEESNAEDFNKMKNTTNVNDAELVLIQECVKFDSMDPLKLLEKILLDSTNPSIDFKTWHYNGIIPGIIIATVKNYQKKKGIIKWELINANGSVELNEVEKIDPSKIIIGIKRGMMIPYGADGYLGISEFAIGAGIATAVMLGSTPKTLDLMELANKATQFALTDLLNKKLLVQMDKKVILESVIISTLKFYESRLSMKFFN